MRAVRCDTLTCGAQVASDTLLTPRVSCRAELHSVEGAPQFVFVQSKYTVEVRLCITLSMLSLT